MKAQRTFIAIQLTDLVRTELAAATRILTAQVPTKSVRWVKPHLMHLTLRFLGDTAVAQLPHLTKQLDQICHQHKPFTLRLDKLGCFPNRNRPRVIWAGLAGDIAAAQRLQESVETAVSTLGWPKETRPFRPHLTLGRVKDSRQLRGVKWGTEIKQVSWMVTAVHLIESQLQPDAPIYTVRHTSQFRSK